MTDFKPGDRVKWHGDEYTFHNWDEGRAVVETTRGEIYANVRHSELTPADPGPDWATLKVRELCAAEAEARGGSDVAVNYRRGSYDTQCNNTAFAKYLRAEREANPPLTVERVREALSASANNWREDFALTLHAALTERKS